MYGKESESVTHAVMSTSLATSQTVALKASLSMRFSRQEYWSGLPFPSLGDLPDPLQAGSLLSQPPGNHHACMEKSVLITRDDPHLSCHGWWTIRGAIERFRLRWPWASLQDFSVSYDVPLCLCYFPLIPGGGGQRYEDWESFFPSSGSALLLPSGGSCWAPRVISEASQSWKG